MSNDLARQIAQSARQFTDPAERDAYLDRVCRGIVRLRADVDRHLAEMGSAEGETAAGNVPPRDDTAERETALGAVPDSPGAAPRAADAPAPADVAEDGAPESAAERVGDRIGRYRLVKPLGEGGFGTVWLAEQVEPVKRSVALKIIKLGMDTEQVVARFEQERQALALMDHPNVARVLDAGATTRGRPYFVMDLVQGVPINEFCDAHRLPVPGRLAVFAQVCAAVQHAHMKGIIHRDLKPSNILVAERDGEPHATVIDFGIAKATSSKLTDRSLVTEAYQVIGTLQYMSPEQSQASPDIDTRTDIYSLGVILYELLTGTTPYDGETFQRAVLSDILRMIGEVDPPAPSAKITETRDALPRVAETRGVEPKRLATALRGELDWIVLKAIEKDRARRYESAEAFAADLRRFLAGEEVTAAPPSATYRLRKFVRRNRGLVAAAGAVAASLVAGIVAFAWQADVARRERDDAIEARRSADAERKRAEAVAGFMESVFEGLDPDEQSGKSGTLKDQILDRLDSVAGDFAKLDADPLGRARLSAALARPLYSLGEYDKAAKLCREAHAIRVAALGESDPLSEGLELTLASILVHAGSRDDALAIAERVRDRRVRENRLSDESQDEIDGLLAFIEQAAGRLDAAIGHYEAIRRRALVAGGADTRDRLYQLHGLGAAYRTAKRTEDAIAVLSDVLARRTALLGADHSDTLITANSLAVAYGESNRNDEALKLLEQVLASFSKRYAPDHPYVLHARMNIAGAHQASGRLPEAVAIAQDVVAKAAARYGEGAIVTVETQYGLAGMYAKSNRVRDAVATLEKLIEPMHRIWGVDHGVVASARAAYVQHCIAIGERARALKFLAAEAARVEAGGAVAGGGGGPGGVAALQLRVEIMRPRVDGAEGAAAAAEAAALAAHAEKALGATHELTLAAQHEAARAAFDPSTAEECLAWAERAHKGRLEVLGPAHADTLRSGHVRGSANWLAGHHAAAVTLLRDTLPGQVRVFGPEDRETVTTALDLAVNLEASGDSLAFVELLSEWLPRALKVFGQEHPHVAANLAQFTQICQQRERLDLMAPTLEVLADAEAAVAGPDDLNVLRIRGNAATCWFKAGRLDKSVPMFEDVVTRTRRAAGPSAPQTLMACANLGVNLRDVGRHDEAIALLEETVRLAQAAGAAAQTEFTFARTEYFRALAVAGRSEQVRALADDIVKAARKKAPPNSAALASELMSVATALLDAKLYAEVEPVLREAFEIRTKAVPGAWSVYSSQGLLGEAVLGQKRFAEAEPLVVSACEGLVARASTMPPASRAWVAKSRDRVLRLYAAWDAAEPGKGHDAKLAEWKAKFAEAAPGGK